MTSTGKGVFASYEGPMTADSLGQRLGAGKGLIGQGKYAEAYELLANTVDFAIASAGHDTLLIYLQLEAGLAAYLMGEPAKANDHYKAVLADEELAMQTSYRTVMDANYRIGIAYRELGDLYLAIDYLEEALHLAKQGPQQNMDIGKCQNALGNLQIRLRNYGTALDHYREAKEIIAEKFGPEHLHVGSILGNMGMAYQEIDSFQASLESHFAALAIRKKRLRENHPTIALNHNNLGDAYLAMGRLDEAEDQYKMSMEMWKGELGPDHVNVAIAHYNLGDIHRERKEWIPALDSYQQAIHILDPEHTTDNWLHEKKGREPRSYVIYLDAMRRKASTIRAMYKAENTAKEVYTISYYYQDLHDLILEMRKGFQREASSRELVGISLGIYEEAIQTCIDRSLYRQDDYREALNYAEAAKGVSLDAALNSQDALRFTGPLAILVNREKDIKEKINGTKLAVELARKQGKVELDSIFNELSQAKEAYNKFVDTLKRNYPDYYELRHQGQENWSLSWLDEMQEGTALISYFIGEDSIYGFGVVREQVFAFNLMAKSELTQRVEHLQNALKNRKPLGKQAEELAELILLPVLAKLDWAKYDRLVIFRDGCLEYIPFEVLPYEGEYLIQRFPISYGYSIRSYFHERGPMRLPQGYLGFARGFTGESSMEELAALPYAVEEVEEAADLFDGKMFLDDEASENTLRLEAERGGILHFATHALLDDRNPLYSKLLLSGNDEGIMENDGNLYTYEIFDLDLGAELAILSACNTGNGQLQSGEGMMSLARGFVYAGCPSILMNHWAASDRESGVIIKDFLGYLGEGMEKDIALQQAKVDYLDKADEIKSHPYFWAGLGLIGDSRPMNIESNGGGDWIWWLLVLGGVVCLIFLWKRGIM